MHRKYLICCTTLYKYLETNISNYSNYFDNYSNVVKAFRLSTAFSSIYSFLLYVNDCMPVYWTTCSWFVPTIWACAHRSSSPRVWLKRISSEQLREWATDIFNKQQIFYVISSIYNILTKKSDVIYFEWIVIWNWEKTPKY